MQNNILWENKNFNLNSSKSIFKKAKEYNIELLLFPEMSFTGFSMNIESLREYNEESIKYISSLCKAFEINAGFGYIHGDPSIPKAKNNYVIINSKGELLCNYTKIHPFSIGLEDKYFQGGEDLVFAEIKNMIICPLICYDLRFPEIFQIASKKCDLITVAANWPASRKNHWLTLLKSRAIENQCYIAGINRVGIGNKINYSGNSMIIDPLGNVLAEGEDGIEDIIIADIDKSVVDSNRLSFSAKNDRREELYEKLRKKIQ